MKRLILILILVLCSAVLQAQVPQAFSYKVQIRGNSGNPHANKKINLKISILQDNADGTAVYIEKHSVNTSPSGVVDIEIGRGTPIQGLFNEIDWKHWPYFIKAEVDLKCGGDYNLIATTELLTVPYAMFAGESADAFSGNYNDLINKPYIPDKLSDLNNDAGFINHEVDGDITNEIQALSVSKHGDTLRLSKSNWVLVPGISDANHCFSNLPSPVLVFKGTEDYTVAGVQYTRYLMEVTNSAAFPDELFEVAPELPPCGINTNSSRSWVDIYNNNNQRIYGFCAYNSSNDLKSIWFSGPPAPDSVYIVINDRRCNKNYVSNKVAIAGATLKPIHDPVLQVQFDEPTQSHNMHITTDGSYYYTINGGFTSLGEIKKYDLNANLVATFPILIDGRGLCYNKADGYLYASLFGGDIVKITNLASGTFQTVFPAKMQNAQASFAISEDGTKFYDFYNGTLKVYDFTTGSLLETLTGLSCGTGNYGGDAAVAVDPDYIYTWNAVSRTVYVYDHSGVLQRTMTLSYGDNGHSISFVNGYLFVSKDAWYVTGTWYGYNIRKATSSPKILVSKEKSTTKDSKPFVKKMDSSLKK